MTAAQKKAQANFKKAIAYRTKTGCSLKEAFAHVKGVKVTGLDKVVKKGNKTSVLYTKTAKKKATTKKKVSQGVLFGTKDFSVKVGDKFQIGDLQYLITKIGIDKGIEYVMKWNYEKNWDYPGSKRIKYSSLAFDQTFNSKNKIGKLSGIKKPAKKSAIKSTHKDTKSHNVNIRVMSGTEKTKFYL